MKVHVKKHIVPLLCYGGRRRRYPIVRLEFVPKHLLADQLRLFRQLANVDRRLPDRGRNRETGEFDTPGYQQPERQPDARKRRE